MQSRTKSLLHRTLKFRGQSTPPTSRPLAIPWLAHADFSRQVRQWNRTTIRTFQDTAVPYHLPPTTLIQSKHPAIKDVLHSWRQWSQLPPNQM